MDREIGKKLKNRYEIVTILGQGGFGCTFKAIDHLLGRFVAVKCSEKSLQQEARILRALDQVPHISHIYDYFVEEHKHYIVMRLIHGISFDEYRKIHGATISANRMKELLPSVVITLDQMHENGIIHRDISPGNFMITEDDLLYLIDFGSATGLKDSALRNPEVFRHQGLEAPECSRLANQGPWTDVYSLCSTIFYLLTGEGVPPYTEREKYDVVPATLMHSSLPAKMQNALIKGLEITPSKRYQSIKAFAESFLGLEKEETEGIQYSVQYHAKTDIGTRPVNQDNFMVDTLFAYAGEDCAIKGCIDCESQQLHIVAVADGVAGSNHGELASKAAIQAVSHYQNHYRNAPGLLQNMVEELLCQLNEKILTLSEKIGKTASTISLIFWRGREMCVANIGDSPIYRLRGGKLTQLYEEQTLSKEKMRDGLPVTEKDLHTLTKYLGKKGIAGSDMAYIHTDVIEPGDVYLLCSDGIGAIGGDSDKIKWMKQGGDKALAKIYKQANKKAEMDNGTAIFLRMC